MLVEYTEAMMHRFQVSGTDSVTGNMRVGIVVIGRGVGVGVGGGVGGVGGGGGQKVRFCFVFLGSSGLRCCSLARKVTL